MMRRPLEQYLRSLNPLSLWALDEAGGTIAADKGSLANHGVYTNTPTLGQASLLPNGYGKSAYFNGDLGAGSRPYVAIPTNAGYDTGSFTIVALAKAVTSNIGGPIINWRDAGNNDGWTLQEAGGGWVAYVHDGVGFKSVTVGYTLGNVTLAILRVNGSAVRLDSTDLNTGVTSTNSAACGAMVAPATSPAVRIGSEAQEGAASAIGIDARLQLVTWIGSAITDAQIEEIQRLAKL